MHLSLQDPSYDPYGFAKVATRTASSEGGAAANCPTNVRKFFQTLSSLSDTTTGLKQINNDMSLCSDSKVESADDVGTLAQYVQTQWVTAVSYIPHLLHVGWASGWAFQVTLDTC